MQSNKTSLWLQTGQYPSFPALDADLSTQVAIVGGGITGLATAYLLLKKGVPVIVLEAGKIGQGTTGFSTGHLTAGIDADYSFLQSRFSKETARLVARPMTEAIDWVEKICRDENLDADFVRMPAYQFATDPNQVKELEDECKAASEAGLRCEALDSVPLPFPVLKAFRLDNQADFHPLKFVQGLSQCIRQMGGLIFENTRVTDVDDSEPCVISTHNGPKVRADRVMLATHTPVQFNMVQTELLPYQSYVVVAELNDTEIPKALYWDTLEFYHYIRTYEADGKKYLVVGGEDHKTGERQTDKNEHFDRLEAYIRTRFGNLPVTHRWSAEFYYSADGLPFIGRSPFGKNKFIATGSTGDGLVLGVVSARLLTDLLTGEENPLAKVYDPARFNLAASATDLVEQNLEFTYHFIKDRLVTDASSVNEIPAGEGRIIRMGLKQSAVYRDENNQLHFLSPVCTHMHCIVQWNNAEKTWDCPCHGGRFRATGEVLTGPPVEALLKQDVEVKSSLNQDLQD